MVTGVAPAQIYIVEWRITPLGLCEDSNVQVTQPDNMLNRLVLGLAFDSHCVTRL